MADYSRIRCNVEVSTASDYSRPYIKELIADTYTPDESTLYKVETATGGTTVTLSNYASLDFVFIHNTDATDTITATFDTSANSSVDNIIDIDAGEWVKLVDVTAAANLTLTASANTPVAVVIASGS